jgi:allantoicase
MRDFRDRIDLASLRLGGAVLWASDDSLGARLHLLSPGDGGRWQTRRRRSPGHESVLVRLGVPGVIRGLVIDTSSFRDDSPTHCAVWACDAPIDARIEDVLADEARWFPLLPKSELRGDTPNLFAVHAPWAFTWVRLDIVPDGGVARLRVHGDGVPDWRRIGHARGELDLAAIEHGGDSLASSNTAHGERQHLLLPDRAATASEGWQTPPRRAPGHDWNLLRLGATGTIRRVEVDTSHFHGDAPEACSLDAIFAPDASLTELTDPRAAWRELLPPTKLQGHTRHLIEDTLAELGEVTHVRFNIFPDGGVARLRVHGSLSDGARRALGVRRLDTLLPERAEAELRKCCGASRWVRAMVEARPFGSVSALLEAADRLWADTTEDDWREAFRSHPRIGESKAAAGQSATEKRWSTQEQRGASSASDAARAALAEVNRAYEARFGHIYLVCATGRTAEELLAIARERLGNEPADELRVAAAEQHKITRLRLDKLLDP